jgi:hypothetical protein
MKKQDFKKLNIDKHIISAASPSPLGEGAGG